jgi:hypothetical protein
MTVTKEILSPVLRPPKKLKPIEKEVNLSLLSNIDQLKSRLPVDDLKPKKSNYGRIKRQLDLLHILSTE